MPSKTGYAILALACMISDKQDWYKVKDIAKRADIPQPYLHKILHALGKSGFIKTKRGRKGGMLLSCPANQITLLDIVEAVQGQEWMHRCLLGFAQCGDERNCPVHEFWKGEKENIKESMKQVTLDQVAEFEGKPGPPPTSSSCFLPDKSIFSRNNSPLPAKVTFCIPMIKSRCLLSSSSTTGSPS